ncbi:fimbria/pilus outer membrane usher protein [Dyella psychrodurans]|uniref:Fimbrial biogenesis outer membrane usher protein n=1 Tax=Dyella psychrodurans TaxID=1927960 RepID=A0A370XC63_9GAMM|nr:fimbria/pilus outer membrane usher protein [Dyella psychrodurans]RDS85860.1 fimbrial biogenesis outer membrane usher protein [Dyella psychrodurans]
MPIRATRTRLRALLAALFLVLSLPAQATTPGAAGADRVWLDTTMNGRAVGQAVEYVQHGVVLSAPAATWSGLSVILKPGETGALTNVQLGLTCTIDTPNQAVACTGPAARFPLEKVGAALHAALPTTPNALGLLLGYDLAVARTPTSTSWSSSQDARFVTPWGVLESTGQLDDTASQGLLYKRGLTTWTTDWASKRLTFQAGDIATNPVANLSSALLGGVRLASDPSLDPSSPSYPIPVIGGVAVGPSKIDAYLNAAPLGTVAQVGQGGYQLATPVAAGGANAMTLVATDAFGRQTTITDSFYVSPTLLRPGLDRWDVDVGEARVDGGDTYTTPGLSASYQRGLSDHWTIQGATQSTAAAHNLIVGAITGGRWGTADLTVGASTGGAGGSVEGAPSTTSGAGRLVNMDYSYVGRHFQVGFGESLMSRGWWDLAQGNYAPNERGLITQRQSTVTLGWTPTPDLQVQGTYARVAMRSGSTQGRSDLRATWSHNAMTIALDLEHASRDNVVVLSASIPLGHNISVNAQALDDERQGASGQVEAMGTWTRGDTLGQWDSTVDRTAAGTVTSSEHVMWRNDHIQDDATISTIGNQVSESNTVSGALWMGSGAYLQTVQPVYDAFAVVRVPGVKGVRVYLENRLMGRTNANGTLVVAPLTSLSANSIRIAAEDLPIGVDVKDVVQTAVPNRKSGTLIVFQIAGQTAREFVLSDAQGHHLPVGSAVTAHATKVPEDTVVGNDGVVYLEDTVQGASIDVDLGNDRTCRATIPTPLPKPDAITPLTCHAGGTK